MADVPIETLSDHDAWHPRVLPDPVDGESFHEELKQELERASAILDPKVRGLKVREDVKLFQLRKVYDLLGEIFGEDAEAKQSDSTLAGVLEFCWQPGRDGFAMANSETAFMRFGAASWSLRQEWFKATSQRMFGIGLKDDAEIRCPNCVERNRRLQDSLGADCFLDARSLLGPNSFVHGEMKKQSINRHVLEFADRFGVRNQHMRSSVAREKFRRLAASKKPAIDYVI